MDNKDLDVIENALLIMMRHEDGAPVYEALGVIDRLRKELKDCDTPPIKQLNRARTYRDEGKPTTELGTITASIDIDTSEAQRKLKELQMMSACMDSLAGEDKEPHIRIEFDSINDVPQVFVDGTNVTDVNHGHGLSQLHLNWQSNTDSVPSQSFKLNYIDQSKHGIVTQSENFRR